MAANEVHVSDVGTVIELTFKDAASVVDISGATTKEVWLSDPSGNTAKKAGTFVTDGTDGKLKYTTVALDIDEAGTWKVQGYIVSAGGTWHSDVKDLEVYANI